MQTENLKPLSDLSQPPRSRDEVLVGWLLSHSLFSESPWRPCSTKHGQLIAPGVNFTMLLGEAIEKMGIPQLSVTHHHWNLEKERFVLGTNQMEVTSQILTSIPSCLFTGTQKQPVRLTCRGEQWGKGQCPVLP